VTPTATPDCSGIRIADRLRFILNSGPVEVTPDARGVFLLPANEVAQQQNLMGNAVLNGTSLPPACGCQWEEATADTPTQQPLATSPVERCTFHIPPPAQGTTIHLKLRITNGQERDFLIEIAN
jgi:hypothetical protein